MATLTQLSTSNLALKGAGDEYNYINRFFATKAEADAALADSSWAPVAGKLNACLTGDQGLLVYNESTSSLDLADAATRAYIDAQIGALVGDAPEVLDTLGEISDALNDNPNYFTDAAAATAANTALINAESGRAVAAENAIQADVDQNEADADAAIAAENAAMLAAVAVVQADVDQNETDADAAIAAVQADVDQNESDADAAIAAVQADVDQNEADADAAIAAENAAMLAAVAVVQADVDQNETDSDAAIQAETTARTAAINALQADVDQNESDADVAIAAETTARTSAITALQADVDQNESDADAAIAAVQADVDANEAASIASLALKAPLASPALTGTPTAPTASQSAGTTQVATTAYVDTAVANLLDSAPGALDTLNELAAAIGDDANFSTTITNSITAVQNDVNQNEVDSDAADTALSGRLDTLEADPTTAAAVAAVQADVDQNEADADSAIAAVQADVDQNESDADAAIAALQADVDQNESDADAAIAAVQADVDQNESDADAAIAAVQADVDQNETDGDAADAALGVRIDSVETEIDTARGNIYTALGRSEGATNLGTFTGSTLSDNTTVRALLQELETDTESRLARTGGTLTGNLSLRKSDGSAVALELSRADHADMNVVWKVTPSYVSATKEVLSVLANGQVVAHFDERQRFAINMNDPDYTLDVGGDGHFSTDLTVGGSLILGSTAVTSTAAELNYTDVAAVGTAEASKAMVLDAGKSISGINQLTCVDLTVQGTTTTVDTVTMQAANAIAFEGATADNNETTLTIIDPDADRTIKLPNQSGCLPVLAADSNTAITSTPEELNFSDGVTSNIQTQLNAIQADVDQNESDADSAIAAVQADVDQNESDADAAIAAVQADVDQNESDADSAIAAVQADVDQNEADADAAIAANETHIDNAVTLTGVAKDSTHLATFTGSTITDNQTIKAALQLLETKVEAVQTDVDGNESDADAAIAGILDGADFTGNITTNGNITCSSGTLHAQYLTLANINVNATATELNYVDGVTSSIQTQLDAKLAASAVSTFGGTLVDDANAGAARTTLGLGTASTTDADAYATAAQGATADAALPASGAQAALHVDHIITLSGVAQAADDLGTFSGSTISDNGTIKAGIQELETAVETKLSAETITLTAFQAVVAASSDFGDFQSRVAAL